MKKEKILEKKRKLNVDIALKVEEIKSLLKDFPIKTRLYNLFYRGKSFDFEGYKEFTQEDDARNIDWKASMRSDKLLVKHYKEELERKICFIIDVSDNMIFGTGDKLKCEYAAELAVSLAYLVITAGHKLSLVLFSDKPRLVVPPKKGIRTFDYFVDFLTDPKNYGGPSNLEAMFDYYNQYLSPSTTAAVIISDFLSFNDNLNSKILVAGKRFETIAFMIRDMADIELPDTKGEFVIEDPKTNSKMIINPSLAKKRYYDYAHEKELRIKKAFNNAHIDLLDLVTERSFGAPVYQFLNQRTKEVAK